MNTRRPGVATLKTTMTETWCFWDGCEAKSPTYWTREQVLKYYWDYWCDAMKTRWGPDVVLEPEACIEDWVIVNWAWKNDE